LVRALPIRTGFHGGVPRRVQFHATLARLLAEWKLAGWERTYDRRPEADDIIVPTRNFTERPRPDAQRSLGLDLDTLKLRRRRGHDLRRTLVTFAQVDGARRDLLETITHRPRSDIINAYSSFPWPALCAEVAKLKIDVREGQVIQADFATEFATRQENARSRRVLAPEVLVREIATTTLAQGGQRKGHPLVTKE
jgi:hypothetical protein